MVEGDGAVRITWRAFWGVVSFFVGWMGWMTVMWLQSSTSYYAVKQTVAVLDSQRLDHERRITSLESDSRRIGALEGKIERLIGAERRRGRSDEP